MRNAIFWFLTLSAIVRAAAAQEVVLVISSDLKPYRQAAEGFIKEFGKEVPVYDLSRQAPVIGTRTLLVAAFGGKAAVYSYPGRVLLVYGLAPGVHLDPLARSAPVVQIFMAPPAEALLSRIFELQPGLKRLTVFWMTPGQERHVKSLSGASSHGVEVFVRKIGRADELPDELRSIKGDGNALWIPPDPLLLNQASFSMMREFSKANDVPFYVPTAELAESGATASFSASFEEMGRAAARAVKKCLESGRGGEFFVEKIETTLNLDAARQAGLIVSPETLKKVERKIP